MAAVAECERMSEAGCVNGNRESALRFIKLNNRDVAQFGDGCDRRRGRIKGAIRSGRRRRVRANERSRMRERQQEERVALYKIE